MSSFALTVYDMPNTIVFLIMPWLCQTRQFFSSLPEENCIIAMYNCLSQLCLGFARHNHFFSHCTKIGDSRHVDMDNYGSFWAVKLGQIDLSLCDTW